MEKVILNISGMHCATCVFNIEHALANVEGVLQAKVNLASEKAYVEFDPQKVNARELADIIKRAGYLVITADESKEKERAQAESWDLRNRFAVSIIFSCMLMAASMMPQAMHLAGHDASQMAMMQFLLATAVVVCGWQFFYRGFISAFKNRLATMDTLVALGVGSAYLYSIVVTITILLGHSKFGLHDLYYEIAAFLISFILLGRFLEARTKRKTSDAIKKLMRLSPKSAMVLRDGLEIEIPVDKLLVGDIVTVKPGQKIPTDGKVMEGHSSIDESMISGESIPVEKKAGDMVIGGTMNKNGFFKFHATKVGLDTALSQIIALVEQAQGSKAPVQQVADKVAAVFVPVVFMIAVASMAAWLFLGKGFTFSLNTFITVLIIACPCALGLATPTAVMMGTGIAAQNGIIIKDASALQMASKVDVVIFDKTGTLTKGVPKVTHVLGYNEDETEVLRLSASIENKSEHPLADAIVAFDKLKKIKLYEVRDFDSIAGKGVRGRIEQFRVLLGNPAFMQDNKIDISHAASDVERLEKEGRSIILLAKDNRLAGLIAVRDELKEFSPQAVAGLKALGKKVMMITGDNARTAEAIAKEAGIERVLAQVMPQDKAGEIKRFQAQGKKVAFIGDGINDAPALAQADLGIALGAGADVAVEAGDIILIKDDLRDVVMAMDLSRYTMRKIRQNLFWAFFYNAAGIPVAAGVLYAFTGFLLNPMIAGFAMAFSSVSVVSNSLSMRGYKKLI